MNAYTVPKTVLVATSSQEKGEKIMAVKIVISRRVPIYKEAEVTPLMLQLRAKAMAKPGYISGETLREMDNSEEWMVISTWESLDAWKSWLSSPERAEVQDKIDAILGEKTQYRVFSHT